MALPWPARYKIAVGAARALSYMHHDCFPPILHRDVKSSNILLDADFEAKIGDFGQSRLLQNLGAEYWVSGYVGSHGYIAPEYVERLKVSEKSDIYSFGVVLLELVSGKKAIDDVEFGEGANIVGWINQTLWKVGGADKSEAEQRVLDRRILDEVGCNFIQEMLGVLCVGLVCTNRIPSGRPSMRDVVGMLNMCRSTPNADEERISTPSALVPLSSSEGEI
uniref:Protein kinase domain-containing protein n=1 Tax=Araucaria cunninghamii TaxID=56994 RepID=A0A0D6QWK2_ARACU